MFLQEITPDTTIYMIMGYAVFGILSAGYVISLVARRRKLLEKTEVITRMKSEDTNSSIH